ncbi:MAG: M56 family peptidase, partial [Muribaculaceae bacterium]|nr:M56 family peptidase [Muribaculaceae bacterium]
MTMGALLSYSLFAGIFLAAGYMAYKAVLSSEKQPGFNRAALLGIYALSLLALPVMSIDLHRGSVAVQEIELLPVTGITVQSAAPAAPLWPRVALAVYLAGAAAVALWTVVALVRLAILLRAGRHERCEGYTIVALNADVVPFSFMHYVVLSETDAANAEMVITHELAHLRCRHWLDLLLAQAVCVLLWYNPASWFMRGELRRAHEY